MVPEIGRRNSRLDERIRYGHGQKKHPHGHPYLPAGQRRGLYPGGGARRPRRKELACNPHRRPGAKQCGTHAGTGRRRTLLGQVPHVRAAGGWSGPGREALGQVDFGRADAFEGQDSRESHPNGLHPSGLPHCEKSLSNEPRPGGETERSVQNLRSRRFSPYPSLDTCRREFYCIFWERKKRPSAAAVTTALKR